MLTITSDSRASDGAFRALADAATAAAGLESWLIVGGHMVNLHVLLAGVDLPLRATRDADLAVELLAIKASPLLDRLAAMGYRNLVSSSRFDRAAMGGTASIDLLVPSYSNVHHANLKAGAIAVDGIPALHVALARPPVIVSVKATLVDGTQLFVEVRIPDVLVAIAIKTFAYAERFAARDAEDLHRLLEVAYAAGLDRMDWPDQVTFKSAGQRLSTFFDSPGRALAAAAASPQQQVRLRALVRSLVGRA